MFSKHVWFDRTHAVEVYIGPDGIVSGTVVAYEGAVCLINPRPEVLTALYQEAKLRRILSVRAIVITDNRIDFTRGLCSFVSYSRGLRRRLPLTIVIRKESRISSDFLSSCCTRLLDNSSFGVEIVSMSAGNPTEVGEGSLRFVKPVGGEVAHPFLSIRTAEHLLHYFDERHLTDPVTLNGNRSARADVTIRAGALPGYALEVQRRILTASEMERSSEDLMLEVIQPAVEA